MAGQSDYHRQTVKFHPQRGRNFVLNLFRVWFASDDLDDPPQHQVIGIRILLRSTWRKIERPLRHHLRDILRRPGTGHIGGKGFEIQHLGQAGSVCQQMLDGDFIATRNGRKDAERRFLAQRTLLDQHLDTQAGKALVTEPSFIWVCMATLLSRQAIPRARKRCGNSALFQHRDGNPGRAGFSKKRFNRFDQIERSAPGKAREQHGNNMSRPALLVHEKSLLSK